MTARNQYDTTPISIDGPLGWESARVAIRGQKYCPWWLTFLNPDTGEVFDFGSRCRSFSHRRCAEQRVERVLHHIGAYLFDYETRIWVTGGECDDGLATRMRVRRNQAQKQSGETINALWVRRSSGAFYVFATAELGGQATPQIGRWMKCEEAYVVARAALTLPGIGDLKGRKGINFSERWRPRSERRSEGLVRLAQKEPVAGLITAEAVRRLGSGPASQPLWGDTWRKPFEVDLDTWNVTVKEVADEIEADNVR